MNRAEAPAFKSVVDIDFIKAEKHKLSNGIPVFIVNAGAQELIRIEFIFGNINWDAS